MSRLVDNYEIKNSTILIFRYDKKLECFFKNKFKRNKKINKIEFTVDNLENKEVRADLIRSLKFYINEFGKKKI